MQKKKILQAARKNQLIKKKWLLWLLWLLTKVYIRQATKKPYNNIIIYNIYIYLYTNRRFSPLPVYIFMFFAHFPRRNTRKYEKPEKPFLKAIFYFGFCAHHFYLPDCDLSDDSFTLATDWCCFTVPDCGLSDDSFTFGAKTGEYIP